MEPLLGDIGNISADNYYYYSLLFIVEIYHRFPIKPGIFFCSRAVLKTKATGGGTCNM
jgi:hypothetical protein